MHTCLWRSDWRTGCLSSVQQTKTKSKALSLRNIHKLITVSVLMYLFKHTSTGWAKKRGHSAFSRITKKLPKYNYMNFLRTSIPLNTKFMSVNSRFNNFIISAKSTKWMAEIMRSFDVCLCVCAAAGHGQSHVTLLNFSALNANNSKTIKATDFKFGTSVPRDSPDMTHKNLSKWGVSRVTWPPKFFGVKC